MRRRIIAVSVLAVAVAGCTSSTKTSLPTVSSAAPVSSVAASGSVGLSSAASSPAATVAGTSSAGVPSPSSTSSASTSASPSKSTSGGAPTPTKAATTKPPATKSSKPSSTSTAPLTGYLAQYQKIAAPVQANEKARLAISASNYPLKFQAQASKMAAALKVADAQLAAATWPAKAQADVKAVIASDVPLIGDLGNVSAALDLLESDASIADTAAHNLQVTLGG